MTAWRRLARATGAALAVPVALALAVYAVAPVYEFASPRPFSGAQWYNPYAPSTAQGDASWHVANFHAHSIAWGGLTNGHQPPADVLAAYRTLGAEIAGLSNYHTIDSTNVADSTWIPTYEYGYSIPKSHRLALGAREVRWLDFAFGATRSQKQWVLDRLRAGTALTVINHPVMRHGHTAADLRELGNYDLLEAMSSYGDSPAEWDAALTAGHAIWAIGSDDNHNITRTDLLGRVWTMVLAPTTRAPAVLAALKAGRQFAVRGAGLHMDNAVRAVRMTGDSVDLVLERPARRIRFIGDGGRELAVHRDAAQARHVATRDDHYVRIVVENDSTTFWLNPVVRWDGTSLPDPRPVQSRGVTWVLRTALLLVLLAAALRYRRRPRR